ncbi:MAG: hypothetical protein WA880_11475 [Ornithinimicrobium sp.]
MKPDALTEHPDWLRSAPIIGRDLKPYRQALVEDGIPLARFAVDDVQDEHDRLTELDNWIQIIDHGTMEHGSSASDGSSRLTHLSGDLHRTGLGDVEGQLERGPAGIPSGPATGRRYPWVLELGARHLGGPTPFGPNLPDSATAT